ncbi:hypothetical protein MSS4_02983 [Mycobacterium marinum]|nr:hypothetical protein MSS4_02983 [Mycobacterium marinum]
MAAAAAVSRAAGAGGAVSAHVGPFHEQCERQVRKQLSEADYRTAGAGGAVSAHVGPFHEQCERQVRKQLSEADYRTATNEGGLLSLDEAAALLGMEVLPDRGYGG